MRCLIKYPCFFYPCLFLNQTHSESLQIIPPHVAGWLLKFHQTGVNVHSAPPSISRLIAKMLNVGSAGALDLFADVLTFKPRQLTERPPQSSAARFQISLNQRFSVSWSAFIGEAGWRLRRRPLRGSGPSVVPLSNHNLHIAAKFGAGPWQAIPPPPQGVGA